MTIYAPWLLLIAAMIGFGGADPGVVISRVVDGFRWQDPFGSHATPPGFQATCEATKTFRATQHVLTDLHKPPPLGLKPWADAIKYFFGGRPFPGSWEGVDAQGVEREIIMMEYTEVPGAVKDWIEEQKDDVEGNKFLFAVYNKPESEGESIGRQAKRDVGKDEDKIVLFAAGSIYEILPLWVAKESDCEAQLLDLKVYNSQPMDGGVIAWPVYHSDPNRAVDKTDITFDVKAQVLVRDPTAEETVVSTAEATETEVEERATTGSADTQTERKDEL